MRYIGEIGMLGLMIAYIFFYFASSSPVVFVLGFCAFLLLSIAWGILSERWPKKAEEETDGEEKTK